MDKTGSQPHRDLILDLLREHRVEFEAFNVKSLMLFGSVARDEALPGSDVDLLVEFERPVGLFEFIGLKQYLENLLGSDVDLGTPNSLRKNLKEEVLREAIRVT